MNARFMGRAAAAAASLLLLALPAAAQAGTGNPWDAVAREGSATLGERASQEGCSANRQVDERQLVHPITAPNI
ncbi:MAG: hypothetical protein VXZ39_08485, partial [Planctomycetota bacterium]|nr:hypothetical protein [Planctomycetota bacterium]